jgi:hypothetical protein
MKKYPYVIACLLLLSGVTACVDEDPVEPTAHRDGITSLTAYFTTGDYAGKEAVTWQIENSGDITDFVIPIPYYYPEDSDNDTEEYLTAMKVEAIMENNCELHPGLGVLDLTKKNNFTYVDPYGNERQITISGEMTRSDACQLISFTAEPGGLSGIIDQDAGTVSLVTAADLSEMTADVIISPHATISPDPTETHNFNDGFVFTVTADNGTDSKEYTVVKQIPPKIASGYRKGSETTLFNIDIPGLGVTDANTIHPTIAVSGSYVVLDLGNGSTPLYFKSMTGTKVGEISLGQADASGAVASDLAGNILICNYAESGQTLNIYKTSSVTEAPELYISYSNALGVGLGQRLHIQGDLSGDAIITATVNNSQNAIRWIVSDGTVGSPENILFSGVNAWGGQDGNAKVEARGTDVSAGAIFDYYDSGNCTMYYAPAWANPTAMVTGDSSGSGWGKNTGAVDNRDFNNVNYTALFSMGYWPDWGLTGYVYLYDTTDPTSVSGSEDTSSSLLYKHQVPDNFSAIGYASDGRFGDVVMCPSADGYFMYVYYASNTHLTFGGFSLDCIDK